MLHGAGIFTNMCHKNHPNVGKYKYTIHGAYGIDIVKFLTIMVCNMAIVYFIILPSLRFFWFAMSIRVCLQICSNSQIEETSETSNSWDGTKPIVPISLPCLKMWGRSQWEVSHDPSRKWHQCLRTLVTSVYQGMAQCAFISAPSIS